MRLDEISPFVRQAIISRMSPGKYTPYKIRTRDHRLFYILGGSGNIVIDGNSYTIQSGMIVLFRSGTEYIWQIGDMRYLAINFDYTRAHTHHTHSFHVERAELAGAVLEPDVCFEDCTALNAPIVLYNGASLEPMFMSIVTEFGVKGEYSLEYLSSLLKLTLISIARKSDESTVNLATGGTIVREIITFIGANYTKPIRNTDIARALHLNPSYMNRVFKAHTGITVRSFIIDYRISAAIDLISGGDLSISDLASAVGFTDVPHFIKTFKARTGKTPKSYGKAH